MLAFARARPPSGSQRRCRGPRLTPAVALPSPLQRGRGGQTAGEESATPCTPAGMPHTFLRSRPTLLSRWTLKRAWHDSPPTAACFFHHRQKGGCGYRDNPLSRSRPGGVRSAPPIHELAAPRRRDRMKLTVSRSTRATHTWNCSRQGVAHVLLLAQAAPCLERRLSDPRPTAKDKGARAKSNR